MDAACTVRITIATHKPTSEQVRHHCHTVLPAPTLIAILPLQSHCSHAHTQEHGTLTHPEMNWASENHEEALHLFKQTMSYYCEDEDITDPGKIALKILRWIGNEGLKRLNASRMSDADKKRPDKIWELLESQLKTNLNFRVHRLHLMDYRQRS